MHVWSEGPDVASLPGPRRSYLRGPGLSRRGRACLGPQCGAMPGCSGRSTAKGTKAQRNTSGQASVKLEIQLTAPGRGLCPSPTNARETTLSFLEYSSCLCAFVV